MNKMLKNLVAGDCYVVTTRPSQPIIVTAGAKRPSDLPKNWLYVPVIECSGNRGYLSPETLVDTIPSYRSVEQLPPLPPKEETFNGLTATECLVIYQSGMQMERVRTNLKGQKYIAAAWQIASGTHLLPNRDPKDPLANLSPTQFIAAQTEFTRLVREKAKKIKEVNETVFVQRDVDYFNE